MLFRVPSWETFEAGAEAAEELAAELGVPLVKAAPRVLSSRGYDLAVRSLLRALSKELRGTDRADLGKFASALDRDWTKLSESERAKVIASAARSVLGVPEVTIGKVQKIVAAHVREIVKIAKRDTGRVHRLKIEPTFTARDEKIVRFAAEAQGNYITDRYRQRATHLEQKARDIVSGGVRDGLGRKDIGALLQEQLVGPALRSSEAYYETVAAAHVGRARSWGQLASFAEAEIDRFVVEAVLDEVTTDVCRFLHGKTFSVKSAQAAYEKVAESEDPEAVKKRQPWVRTGRTKDGERVLFVKTGTRPRLIATVVESGVGTSDKIGSFDPRVDDAALQRLGVMTPPFHGRCRTTIVPA